MTHLPAAKVARNVSFQNLICARDLFRVLYVPLDRQLYKVRIYVYIIYFHITETYHRAWQ